MADLRDLPLELQQVIERAITQVDRLSDRLERGNLSPDDWLVEMERLLGRHFQTAAMAGANSQDVADLTDSIASMLGIQFAYLDNFKNDLDATGWQPAYRSRAQMYAEAIKQSYWLGDMVRQVGRVIPLPAMPSEGTQCLSRCKCHWRIETVNAEGGDYDAYWEISPVENCQTCTERRAQWYPVRIRGGELL